MRITNQYETVLLVSKLSFTLVEPPDHGKFVLVLLEVKSLIRPG